jgi:hypothetical protein
MVLVLLQMVLLLLLMMLRQISCCLWVVRCVICIHIAGCLLLLLMLHSLIAALPS